MKAAWCALLIACGPGGDDGFDGPVRLAIIPDDFQMSLDRSVQLQVALQNDAGDYFQLEEATFRFDSSKVRITDEGVAEPLVTGDVTFEAEAEGFTGRATFHVMDRKPLDRPTQTLSVGEFEACWIGTDNATYCIENNLTPLQRSTEPFSMITASSYRTCALRPDGVPVCDFDDNSTPTALGMAGMASIATGRDGPAAYTCGITTDGKFSCQDSMTPFVSGTPRHTFSAISRDSRCAITTGWMAYCGPTIVNGNEDVGATGTDGFENMDGSPAPVRGNQFWQMIVDGDRASCGLDLDGKAYCWGLGELGSNEVTDPCGEAPPCHRGPALVSGDQRWVTLAGGRNAFCGITTEGATYCWHGVTLGGGATPTMLEKLTLVAGGHQFNQIEVGSRFVCASKANGELWCWGVLPGQTPTTQAREPVQITTPVPVKSPG